MIPIDGCGFGWRVGQVVQILTFWLDMENMGVLLEGLELMADFGGMHNKVS